jgi:hypothetical protein
MRKLTLTTLASIFLVASTVTASYAGTYGIGIQGAITTIKASGSETGTVNGSDVETNRAADVSNDVVIPGIYAEYTTDLDYVGSLTLGLEMVPGSADVSNSVLTRTDTETSVSGTAAAVSNQREFKAQAEVENYNTIYAEIPFPLFDLSDNGAYVRLGFSQIDLNTTETASGNGGSYGNTSVDGINYGIGFKNNMTDNFVMKVSYEATDFDSINLTSTGNSADSGTNSISANLDTWAIKVAMGYEF